MINKKAFTMLEIISVVALVGILMVILVPRLSKYTLNSKIDTVEAELRTFALDLNNYVVDYGAITMTVDDSEVQNTPLEEDETYVKWTYEFVDTLNEMYIGNTLDLASIQVIEDEIGRDNPHKIQIDTDDDSTPDTWIYDYFKVKTMYKKDPWGNKYILTFHTRETGTSDINKILGHGIVIVQSMGPDQTDESELYTTREFGEGKDASGVERIDDIILIIQTK